MTIFWNLSLSLVIFIIFYNPGFLCSAVFRGLQCVRSTASAFDITYMFLLNVDKLDWNEAEEFSVYCMNELVLILWIMKCGWIINMNWSYVSQKTYFLYLIDKSCNAMWGNNGCDRVRIVRKSGKSLCEKCIEFPCFKTAVHWSYRPALNRCGTVMQRARYTEL
jgi:hypothetical protein